MRENHPISERTIAVNLSFSILKRIRLQLEVYNVMLFAAAFLVSAPKNPLEKFTSVISCLLIPVKEFIPTAPRLRTSPSMIEGFSQILKYSIRVINFCQQVLIDRSPNEHL
jgi:hypothetical protein